MKSGQKGGKRKVKMNTYKGKGKNREIGLADTNAAKQET